MARGEEYASTRTKDAVKGGGGIPAGVTVTIHEDTIYTTGHEAPAEFVKQRNKEDALFKLVLEDEDGVVHKPEWLSTGKGFEPAAGGQHLRSRNGAKAAMNEGATFMIFFRSLEEPKSGKLRVPEDIRDDGLKGMYGIKFVTGREVIQRQGLQPQSALIADSVVALPGGKKGRPSREEDEEAPAKPKKAAAGDDFDAEAEAERLIVEALELPKYRKGLPAGQAFVAVLNGLKEGDLEKDQKKEVMALVDEENPKWARSSKRPWEYDKDEDLITKA